MDFVYKISTGMHIFMSLARFSHENSDGDFEHPISVTRKRLLSIRDWLKHTVVVEEPNSLQYDLDGAISRFQSGTRSGSLDHSCAYATRGRVP